MNAYSVLANDTFVFDANQPLLLDARRQTDRNLSERITPSHQPSTTGTSENVVLPSHKYCQRKNGLDGSFVRSRNLPSLRSDRTDNAETSFRFTTEREHQTSVSRSMPPGNVTFTNSATCRYITLNHPSSPAINFTANGYAYLIGPVSGTGFSGYFFRNFTGTAETSVAFFLESSPASIGADQNNYALPLGCSYLRLTSSGAYNITRNRCSFVQ